MRHDTISATEAADRLAIRELVEAYAHCADRRDAKGQMSLFTVDTHFVVYMNAKDPTPSMELRSREALAPVFASEQVRRHDALRRTEYHLTLTNDRATGEAYCLAHHVTVAGGQRRVAPLSRHVREDRWRVALRGTPPVRRLDRRTSIVMRPHPWSGIRGPGSGSPRIGSSMDQPRPIEHDAHPRWRHRKQTDGTTALPADLLREQSIRIPLIPKSVDDLVLACLQKDPALRPTSVDQVLRCAMTGTADDVWDEESARKCGRCICPTTVVGAIAPARPRLKRTQNPPGSSRHG
jgi:serine/threonine protein kinase